MFLGCAAQPVADFQVGDKTSGRGEGGADYSAHNQCGHHASRTFQADGHHDDGSQDEGHQCHAGYGVAADNRNGVGRNRSEEKSDNGYEKHSGEREEQVAFHDPEIEKQQDGCQGQERADSNDFHR